MDLFLKREEVAMLLANLKIMRKNVKKGLKKSYGRKEGNDKTIVYDSIVDELEYVAETFEEYQFDLYVLKFNKDQLVMIHDFLNFYIVELGKMASGNEKNVNEVFDIVKLTEINSKVNELLITFNISELGA